MRRFSLCGDLILLLFALTCSGKPGLCDVTKGRRILHSGAESESYKRRFLSTSDLCRAEDTVPSRNERKQLQLFSGRRLFSFIFYFFLKMLINRCRFTGLLVAEKVCRQEITRRGGKVPTQQSVE